MQIALWIVSAVLAVGFIGGAIVRATQPIERLRSMQLGWVGDLPRSSCWPSRCSRSWAASG